MEFLKWLLLPFGWLYGGIMSLRNAMYNSGLKKSTKLGIPVISIGNISAGGTGKTPMAEHLLRTLQNLGRKPAYLSRGYGRKSKGYFKVDPEGRSDQFGDEAIQVAAKFPNLAVAVCEDRVLGAQRLISEEKCDVIVLDDAFQHRRIARDLDLIMVDGTRPPHKDLMLPAGRLREPLNSLKRADLIVFNKVFDPSRQKELLNKYRSFNPAIVKPIPLKIVSFSNPKQSLELKSIQGKPVFAFSGVGNNASFQTVIETSGGILHGKLEFPDHHSYTDKDLAKILDKFEGSKKNPGDNLLLLTSEKDYFRIRGQASPDFLEKAWYLEIGIEWIEGKEDFDSQINKTLQLNHE